MPSSLNCPTCGAPAPGPDAARCEFCGSALTSMACPSCFSAMFAGMQFCPHCGAKGARVVGDATLGCPGCRGEMRAVQIGTTPMFECSACDSTWLDADMFAQLCLNREERARVASTIGSTEVSVVPTAGAGVRYRSCPRCSKLMNRENFGRRSGVIIDVCKGHGVWFERGELSSVAAFIDGGGLERARAREEERQLQERRALEKQFDESGRHVSHHFVATLHVSLGERNDSLVADALRMLLS